MTTVQQRLESPPPDHGQTVAADLREIGHDLWQYRNLLYQLTLRDIRIRYKQAVMGLGWALLVPMLVVASGFLVRLAISFLTGDPIEASAVAGIAVKAIPWGFFVGAIQFSTTSLTSNVSLVSKIYFPREVIPISSVLAMAFDSIIGAAVLALLLPFMGVSASMTILWLPVMAGLAFLLTTALALFLSCANLFFRDVKYIVQVLVMFGIFFTPVFFDASMFGQLGAKIIMLNPLAPILEGLRLCIVEGHGLLQPLVQTSASGTEVLAWTPWYLAYSATWSVFGLMGAALLFHRTEFVFAEYV